MPPAAIASSVVVTISSASGRGAAQEKLEHRCGRKLRCPAETTVGAIERPGDALLRPVEERRRQRLDGRRDPRGVADGLDESLRLSLEVAALCRPGLGNREQQL